MDAGAIISVDRSGAEAAAMYASQSTAARRSEEGAGFGAVLGRYERRPEATPQEAAREAAEEFVAVSLVQPILASLREQNNAAEPFAPGDAERRFAPLWDAEIARRISKAEQFDIVDVVARQLLRSAGLQEVSPEVDAHA
ncbi:MAG: hypothetical protein VYC34_07970 [Planctomycetota bacterium]|nr:hypothetical protein [Planctomycetota bacterium]